MKKMTALLLVFLLCAAVLTGCSGGTETTTTAAPDSLVQSADLSNGNVDVDLTKLTSIMVYSEVSNIMTTPEKYMGKIIKMKGMYSTEFYDVTQKNYHYVVIADAEACCSRGLEFVWKGDHKVPDDYPEAGAEVKMSGVFGSYQELDQTWYYIAVDTVTVL